jgi:hypothetical protein
MTILALFLIKANTGEHWLSLQFKKLANSGKH